MFSSVFEIMRCWVRNQIHLSSNIETYQDTQVTSHSVYRFIMVNLWACLVTSWFICEHVLLRRTAILKFLFKRFASPKYATEGLNMLSDVFVPIQCKMSTKLNFEQRSVLLHLTDENQILAHILHLVLYKLY